MDIDLMLTQAKAEGLSISLTPEQKLRIVGDKSIYQKWIGQLKNERDSIVRFLKIEPTPLKTQFIIDLMNCGVSQVQAQAIEKKIKAKNESREDRTLCFECKHLKGYWSAWRCQNQDKAGIGRDGSLGELAYLLQRCDGFKKNE